MTEFANVPQSVAELRASREHSGRLWSPRDVLVAVLRDLDAGKIKPTDLVVTFVEPEVEGKDSDTEHVAAYQSRLRLLGACVKAVNWISGRDSWDRPMDAR